MCYIERNVVYECSVYYGVIISGSCVQRDSSVSSFCPLETSVPMSGCVCVYNNEVELPQRRKVSTCNYQNQLIMECDLPVIK